MSCRDEESLIEHRSIRLERIATEIVYNEYQRSIKKDNGINPENYSEALHFLDLQLIFTEEGFNDIMQKALKILYNIEENSNDQLRTLI